MADKEQRLTRREALKRIALATVLAGAAISGKDVSPVEAGGTSSNAVYINYSKYSTYGSYADPVYLNYSSTGYRSIQYYTSYRSHNYYVPPPR